MTAAVLTPFVRGRAIELGNQRWWKRLLPVGEINYKGQVLKFSRDYLAGLVQAFRDRAYDQVPFQLAGDDNKHTNDVERYGGKITDMDLRPDGLWIQLDPTERGSKVLLDNPECGVSARIVEGYDRSDGKFFPKAIQHVLATLDPRIPGLGAWQTVEASNDTAVITFDLSGAEFTGEEDMALTAEQQAKLAKLLEIPEERFNELVEGLSLDPADIDGLNGGEGAAGEEGGELSDAELDALVAEAQRLEAAGELDDVPSGQPEPALSGSSLSNAEMAAIELAQATGDENARQLAIINAQLDRERWANERRRLVAANVPPVIADLAQPLLEGSGHVVDLANGTSVDSGAIVRKILTTWAGLSEQLGLGVELGTPMDEPNDGSAAEARNDVVNRAKAQMGLI